MDDPSEQTEDDPLEELMEALREAEDSGWHHCARGTIEGDHYDRLVHLVAQMEARGDE